MPYLRRPSGHPICLPLRRLLPFAVAAAALAQVPLGDLRNKWTPDPDTHFTMPAYTSRRAWEARARGLRGQILSAAGLLPLASRPPVRGRTVWSAGRNGVIVEAVLLETLPGFYVGGNVYRPAAPSGRLPAVLSPHGHWKHGRIENLSSYSVPALGFNLARQGYFVFAWDMVGYNDTMQVPHDFGGWREQLWSFSPMGLQLWNSMRALDYVRSRKEVDPQRVAVTGASGGGTQTFLLTAVDHRVRIASPVNMVSAYMQGGDPCEEAPGLRVGTFNVEFAAMAAPRPMLLVSDTTDWTRHTPQEEFPAIRRIYNLFGRPDRVQNYHQDARHNYNRLSREAVYRFLAALMHPAGAADLTDHDISLPDPQELLALSHSTLPPGALDYGGVFGVWRQSAGVRLDSAGEAARRECLRDALGAEWPGHVESAVEGRRLVLSRTGRGDRVSGIWVAGHGPPVLAVHPDGAEAALRAPKVARLVEAGRLVFAIDAFQTGAAKAVRNRSTAWFLSYNRTDDANRVQDILTALAFLKTQARGRPHIVGLAGASVWCLFAAAAAPSAVDLTADLNGFSGSDEDFRDKFFVPGIQAAGGLAAAQRLALR